MSARKRTLSPAKIKTARNVSDMLALWPLCAKPACRKAGACRALPLTCLNACLPFVPKAAGAFVFALFDGKEENLCYDDALAQVPEELREEWMQWHGAIARITGRPSLRPAAGRREP